jgi:hypothetical protein
MLVISCEDLLVNLLIANEVHIKVKTYIYFPKQQGVYLEIL